MKNQENNYKVYVGDSVGNEWELSTSKDDKFDCLESAINTFIAEANQLEKKYLVTGIYREIHNFQDGYEFNSNELVFVELRKLDEDGDLVEWQEGDFDHIDAELVAKLQAVVGTLEGWLQTSEYVI